MTNDKPTLEIDREKNEVTIKCNGDTIKFKDDNVEVTRASKNMMFKSPDITPQLAISAFAVLHQYCSSISPHDCIRCAFYVSVPCRGTTFLNAIKTFINDNFGFPSPVGELHFSISIYGS